MKKHRKTQPQPQPLLQFLQKREAHRIIGEAAIKMLTQSGLKLSAAEGARETLYVAYSKQARLMLAAMIYEMIPPGHPAARAAVLNALELPSPETPNRPLDDDMPF